MIWSAKWWTLMMNSVIPKVRRRVRVISRRVRPESSTRALGRVSVSGLRRVPRPADRIIAFMRGLSLKRFPLAEFFELEMADGSFHAISTAQAFCQVLGEENGAVLAAGAAKGDHEVFEAALLVGADAGVDQG